VTIAVQFPEHHPRHHQWQSTLVSVKFNRDAPSERWVEPRRQRSRANEIAEHYRQLPTFGSAQASAFSWSRRLGRRDRRIGTWGARLQSGDRGQQLAPMADGGNAELLQVDKLFHLDDQ
jgi:hypothetical protein